MSDQIPAWLAGALPGSHPSGARLSLARLGSAEVFGRDGFTLNSAAFGSGEEMDPSFTADEEDAVAPPLEWSAPPADAVELVLVVEDATSAHAEPFCHWLVWGLAPQRGKLLEGEVPPRVGKNGFGNSEWALPDPPLGDDPHLYAFQLFALDTPLALMPGATRADLLAAMKGHVVAAALLTATHAKSDLDDDGWDADED